MNNLEFDILDELYFVISYRELMEQLTEEDDIIRSAIYRLHKKGWVRVFASPDDTLDYEELTDELLSNSYLLASKSGLKAHNSA